MTFGEKERRIYYQNIVYEVCELIRWRSPLELKGDYAVRPNVGCGTVEEPSTEVIDRLRCLLNGSHYED